MDLISGCTASAELIVKSSDLASGLPLIDTDEFPPVLATARMIALMEIAAARVLQPLLKTGELSVGVEVSIRHTAPTPAGAKVTAEARYCGMENKLYRFEVIAYDEAGEIGRGVHHRAIINTERLSAGASKRRNPSN